MMAGNFYNVVIRSGGHCLNDAPALAGGVQGIPPLALPSASTSPIQPPSSTGRPTAVRQARPEDAAMIEGLIRAIAPESPTTAAGVAGPVVGAIALSSAARTGDAIEPAMTRRIATVETIVLLMPLL